MMAVDEKCLVVLPHDFDEALSGKLEEIRKCANRTESGDGEGCNERTIYLDKEDEVKSGLGKKGNISKDDIEESDNSSTASIRRGTLGAVRFLVLPTLAALL